MLRREALSNPLALFSPECPVCCGRGVLDGVNDRYGTTTDCRACDGAGVLSRCAECKASFQPDDEPEEVRVGVFCCARCAREVFGQPEVA